MLSKTLKKQSKNKNDNIHTPFLVAQLMIDACKLKPGQRVLDPSRGETKVFYDDFPKNTKNHWCEITEGKDFFEYNRYMDWIIGNPPYSMWDKWLDHTMEITNNFCYIFSCFNITPRRMKKILDNGFNLTYIHLLNISHWFSQSFIMIFQRKKHKLIHSS
eukprot:Lithocolla_globosa_v1_NODE_25_length_9285_cov_133.641170.p6 type:complete len:160 gc:universal NODE_25_length_9285_cov_133.641170:4605-4126(-)